MCMYVCISCQNNFLNLSLFLLSGFSQKLIKQFYHWLNWSNFCHMQCTFFSSSIFPYLKLSSSSSGFVKWKFQFILTFLYLGIHYSIVIKMFVFFGTITNDECFCCFVYFPKENIPLVWKFCMCLNNIYSGYVYGNDIPLH